LRIIKKPQTVSNLSDRFKLRAVERLTLANHQRQQMLIAT
jgi:hypothetical protein